MGLDLQKLTKSLHGLKELKNEFIYLFIYRFVLFIDLFIDSYNVQGREVTVCYTVPKVQ